MSRGEVAIRLVRVEGERQNRDAQSHIDEIDTDEDDLLTWTELQAVSRQPIKILVCFVQKNFLSNALFLLLPASILMIWASQWSYYALSGLHTQTK